MTLTRTLIIFGASLALSRACVIAVRYACVRRQFIINEGDKQERKIIDYQTHQHILGTNLANSLIMAISAKAVEALMSESNKQVEVGNFKLLDICHHYTSGMKAVATEMTYRGTDELR